MRSRHQIWRRLLGPCLVLPRRSLLATSGVISVRFRRHHFQSETTERRIIKACLGGLFMKYDLPEQKTDRQHPEVKSHRRTTVIDEHLRMTLPTYLEATWLFKNLLNEGLSQQALISADLGHPIVAIAEVHNNDGNEPIMLHNKPIKHGFMKVSILVAKMPNAPLLVPIDDARTIGEAIGRYIARPRHLIVPITTSESSKNLGIPKSHPSHISAAPSKLNMRTVTSKKLSSGKSEKLTTTTLKVAYKLIKYMTVVEIPSESAVMGYPYKKLLTKEAMTDWILQSMIGATELSIYCSLQGNSVG